MFRLASLRFSLVSTTPGWMGAGLSLLLGIGFVATAAGQGQPPQRGKDAEVPDVALVIPEEVSPETKALMIDKFHILSSPRKSVEEKTQAAEVLAALGEKGRPARVILCRGMIDPKPEVRAACADALGAIDPKMQLLAKKLVQGDETVTLDRLIEDIGNLKSDGLPLTPLVAEHIKNAGARGDERLLRSGLKTLASIARTDIHASRLVAAHLNHASPEVRIAVLGSLPGMKHGRLYTARVTLLLNHPDEGTVVAAMAALVALADESTEELIHDAIAKHRHHRNDTIRKACEESINKLELNFKERAKNDPY